MNVLHAIGQALRDGFLLIPLPAVRALFVGLLVALLLWVWSLPVAPADDASPTDRRAARRLKWIASVALGIQIGIYLWL